MKQGELSRYMVVSCGQVWSVIFQSLHEEQIKFSLIVGLDVLSHNANLHL